MAPELREHAGAAQTGRYETLQVRRDAGILAFVFGFAALLPTSVLVIEAITGGVGGTLARVWTGLCAVGFGVQITKLLWRYTRRSGLAVIGCADHLAIVFPAEERGSTEIPYSSMVSAEAVPKAGRPWANPFEGVFCPYGLGARPGVRIGLRGPWGPKKLKVVSVVVPDPDRLAVFLRRKVEGA